MCFAILAIVMSTRQSISIITQEWIETLDWSKTFIQSVALNCDRRRPPYCVVWPVAGPYILGYGIGLATAKCI
jgi:hypothetical protein